MKQYYVVNSEGVIFKWGTCQDDLLEHHAEGETLIEGVPPPGATHFRDGKFSTEEPPKPVLPYGLARLHAYPSITDQIGALMKGGQELIDMQAKIQAVKDQFPKP